MEGWRGRLRTACESLCAGLIYDLPWRRREEQPVAPRKRGEKRESLVKWHFGKKKTTNTTKSCFSSLCERVYMHTAFKLTAYTQI